MAQGLNVNFMITLFYDKRIILTNRSCVNDTPILAQKQQKMAIFDKTDFWGLKYPLEVRSQNFMKIGAKMATLQEKTQKWTLKNVFLKNLPGF